MGFLFKVKLNYGLIGIWGIIMSYENRTLRFINITFKLLLLDLRIIYMQI